MTAGSHTEHEGPTRRDGAEAAATERFGRDAVVVTVCTLLSRVTGFVRVLVAAACLGVGLLGDTYAAANMVPNIVFELVAGGVLQAVLVPTFVAAHRDGGDAALGRAAAVVASTLTAFLAVVAVVGVALGPVLADLLVAGDASPASTDREELMARMLVVFVPQIVFYGLGMVSTAALAAKRRFVAAALAPAVNNAIVIACYLAYRATLDGRPTSLHLDPLQFALVAGGTTLAVVAFTVVPSIALARTGVPVRATWDPAAPAVARVRGAFGWAMLSVGGTLAPTAAAIVLGSGAPGAVAVFTMTFAFFVLPHSLVALPIATTVAPRIADAGLRHDAAAVRDLVERSVRIVVPPLLLAGAAMLALAWPVARVASSFGDADAQGVAPIAQALAVFGCGLLGHGLAFTMVRVLFSLGDVRAASIIVGASAVIGIASMAIASRALAEDARAAALALGYGVTQLVSAALLTVRVRRRTGAPSWHASGRPVVAAAAGAAVAAVVASAVSAPFGHGRTGALAATGVGGAAAAVAFACTMLLAGVRPSQLALGGRRAG